MIDQALIDSARMIKNEFESLNSILEMYETDVMKMANNFFKVSEDLKNIESTIKDDSIDSIKKKVLDMLTSLEDESSIIGDKVDEINIKLEKLKKEEITLYNVIKRRYPTLSDEEIKIDIQKRI